jgi:hypothetical protein
VFNGGEEARENHQWWLHSQRAAFMLMIGEKTAITNLLLDCWTSFTLQSGRAQLVFFVFLEQIIATREWVCWKGLLF